MSAQVAIVMGSTSDAPIMAVAEETLKGLGIEYETRVLSAHRTPDEVRDWARGLAGRGIKVVIAAFAAPASPIATVATGTPRGICTVESSASSPPAIAYGETSGTPMTGSV